MPDIDAQSTPASHVTVYEFRRELAEWYLPDLLSLRQLLVMSQGVPVSIPVLIRMVDEFIDRAVEKVG